MYKQQAGAKTTNQKKKFIALQEPFREIHLKKRRHASDQYFLHTNIYAKSYLIFI